MTKAFAKKEVFESENSSFWRTFTFFFVYLSSNVSLICFSSNTCLFVFGHWKFYSFSELWLFYEIQILIFVSYLVFSTFLFANWPVIGYLDKILKNKPIGKYLKKMWQWLMYGGNKKAISDHLNISVKRIT